MGINIILLKKKNKEADDLGSRFYTSENLMCHTMAVTECCHGPV